MRRLNNSVQNLLHINSNIHNAMALALICVGNDISLDFLAFLANSLGQSTGSATPHSPSPFPSATNEKDISRRREGRPSRLLWPRYVSVLYLTGFDASGVAGFPARQWGWAGRTHLTASLHLQPRATTLLSSILPPQPAPHPPFSLPEPLPLSCNNNNKNLFLCNTYKNTIIKCGEIQNAFHPAWWAPMRLNRIRKWMDWWTFSLWYSLLLFKGDFVLWAWMKWPTHQITYVRIARIRQACFTCL